MLKPSGSLLVADPKGPQVAQRSFQLDTFLPRTQIDYPVLLPGQVLKPGNYSATVTLRFAGKTIVRTFTFTVSQTEYTDVFQGAAPVKAPSSRGSMKQLLPWTVATLALLIAMGALVYRRFVYSYSG